MDTKAKIKEKLGKSIINWNQHSAKRFYLGIGKEDVREAARVLFHELGLRFNTASGVDTPLGFEIVYHFSSDASGEIFSLKVLIEDKKYPEIDSITPLFPGAEWIEREIWEMLGINFKDHPNLKKLLLADDWPQDNYPLRQE